MKVCLEHNWDNPVAGIPDLTNLQVCLIILYSGQMFCSNHVLFIDSEYISALLFVMIALICPPPPYFVQIWSNFCVVRFDVIWMFGLCLVSNWIAKWTALVQVHWYAIFSLMDSMVPISKFWMRHTGPTHFLKHLFLSPSP